MSPRRLVAALALLPILPAAARAAEGPVCALPEVLQVVSDELAARGIYGTLDPTGVGERSAPGAPTVLCSVKLLMRYYDAPRYGAAPQYRMEVRGYKVQVHSNSLRVDLLD